MRPDFKTHVFTVIVILSNVIGDSALKWGMRQEAGNLDSSPLTYLRVFLNPWVFGGVSLLILWMLSRMALLSWADLSYVLPVTSVGYVLVALVGRFVFAESISPTRWAGTACIIGGMILVGGTNARSSQKHD